MRSVLFLAIILMIGCKSADIKSDYPAMKNLVESGSFEIRSTSANPTASNELNQLSNSNLLGVGSSASRIDLSTNNNFLRVHNDTVSAYLPYFGVRRSGIVNTQDDGAIRFDGKPENYTVTYDDKRGTAEIDFSIRGATETFDVRIEIFSNLRANIGVNSTYRDFISYDGSAMRYVIEE